MDSNNEALTLEQAGVSMSELKALQDWYVNKAEVEMIMFNIGEVHDINSEQATAFTTIFWNQFNKMRGYNSDNLPLAQYLEKALDEDGKFGEFKEYVKSKGYDWKGNISRFAAGRLDEALEMAKEVDNSLTIDAIRQKIINNDINVSVEAFAAELKEHLERKGNSHHRILFFVDEVSQFIGEHPNLLLQLQSLVEHLYETCNSQVWIACTAQQSLDDVVSGMGGNTQNPNDGIGKILGRFEVRASLQGTKPEYITQRRILEKNDMAEIELSKMFEQDKSKLDAQFILPSTYYSYRNENEFVDYYPFVPYQFQLIMKVLDSFVSLNYVDRQVKGNERSLLNITFSIAKETAEWETGKFIPFDRFYGAMFQGSMQHPGQRAFENARLALELLKDDQQKQKFYRRVVYVLFMICNLSEVDKQSFSATIDNIVTLLMEKVDENKAVMKDKVSDALGFLEDKSVIHKVKKDNGIEIYEFYSQEESKVAQLIINTPVDSNTYSEQLYNLISPYFNLSNKVTYATRSFNIGCTVDGRLKLSNNADIIVDFLTNAPNDSASQFAFNNQRNHLVFFLYPLFTKNKQLQNDFLYYCRVQKFSEEPAISEERQRIKRMFQDDAKNVLDKDIKPALQGILDECAVIAGQSVLTAFETGSSKGKDRYYRALDCHLGKLYESAQLVDNNETPKNANELRDKILRPIEDTLIETPLSKAEEKMKDYLDRQTLDVTVDDIVRNFAKPPYGWSEIATIYTLNELVRHNLYAYNYNNNPNVSRDIVANNIVRESSRFTVEKARAISKAVINSFIDAWKHIFNVMSINSGNDPNELYRNCKESDKSVLNTSLKKYRILSKKLSSCPCVSTIDEAVKLLEEWSAIRSQVEFFTTITAAKDTAKTLFDSCKEIESFANEQYGKYSEIIKFIDDNRDNFNLLPVDKEIVADEIKSIKDDMRPWDNLPKYLRYMRSLNGMLQGCRQELEGKIKKNYEVVFDELEGYARENGVSTDIIPDRNSTIQSKCATNNLYALQVNLNTSEFRREQYKNINVAINDANRRNPRIRETINITTHTIMPLRTEADVDEYLQKLKAEIMNHLTDNNEIVIL